MNINKQVTVANAAAGADLISGDEQAQVGYNRFMVALALIGGNAVGEPVVEIKVGGKRVETVRGSATGLGLLNTHFKPSRVKVPANYLVQAVVTTAPTVSPILIDIEFIP